MGTLARSCRALPCLVLAAALADWTQTLGCSANGGGSLPAEAGDAGLRGGTDGSLEDAPSLPADAAVPDAGPPDASTRADGSVFPDATTPADGAAQANDASMTYRNPLVQPFDSTSIWNMPIGSGAHYVPATIAAPTANTLQGDQDILVLTPTAPSTPIYENSAAWQSTVSRCPYDQGPLFYSAPIPTDFVVGDDPVSDTPNNAFAVLLSDNRTLKQNQPFTRCTAGDPATTYNTFPDVDLYGDGASGAHGGSALSAIGGTLRVGELLRPGGPPPSHALKLELWAAQNYYNDGNQADCYRWPATTCDGYFNDSSSALKYGGTNSAVRPGALLALPASVPIASLGLTTGAAQLLASTLQGYGAYLVDDSAWSSVSLCVEYGPAGSFEEQFQSDWGFSLNTNGTTSDFAKDVATLLGKLEVVDNNAASSVGGGGAPLRPLAPPLPPAP